MPNKIKRFDFQNQYKNHTLSLNNLSVRTKEALESGGSSIRELGRQADLNRDGVISGEAEAAELFNFMHDEFSSADSDWVMTHSQGSRKTIAGNAYEAIAHDYQRQSSAQIQPLKLYQLQGMGSSFDTDAGSTTSTGGTTSSTSTTSTGGSGALGDAASFAREFAGKVIDPGNFDQGTVNKLWSLGETSVYKLQQFDRNGDKKLSTDAEFRALHSFLSNQSSSVGSGVFDVLKEVAGVGGGSTTSTGGTTSTTSTTSTGLGWLARKLGEGGKASIREKTDGHLKALRERGVGTYTGRYAPFRYDKSDKSVKSTRESMQFLEDKGVSLSYNEVRNIEVTDCIGWVMENLEAAYAKAGKSGRFNQINAIMRRNEMRGIVLAKELKKDGWESVFYTNDASDPNAHDTKALRSNNPTYYGVEVDHVMKNFRPDSGTADESGLDKLDNVPFFVGLSNGGSHTFTGYEGIVSEVHWADGPTSDNVIEETSLKSWGSGMVMVPPGSWNQ